MSKGLKQEHAAWRNCQMEKLRSVLPGWRGRRCVFLRSPPKCCNPVLERLCLVFHGLQPPSCGAAKDQCPREHFLLELDVDLGTGSLGQVSASPAWQTCPSSAAHSWEHSAVPSDSPYRFSTLLSIFCFARWMALAEGGVSGCLFRT